jgi:hypothetical protein
MLIATETAEFAVTLIVNAVPATGLAPPLTLAAVIDKIEAANIGAAGSAAISARTARTPGTSALAISTNTAAHLLAKARWFINWIGAGGLFSITNPLLVPHGVNGI